MHSFKRSSTYDLILKIKKFLQEVDNDPSIVDSMMQTCALSTPQLEKLYHVLYRLNPALRQEIQKPWQLLVLSGEQNAFEAAAKHYEINANSHTEGGLNTLHLAALSGAPDQVKRALSLGIAFDSTSNEGLNTLHYAVLSKSAPQLQAITNLEKEKGITLAAQAASGLNLLMLGAFTGNPTVFEAAKALAKERGINEHATYKEFNAGHFAMAGNNQRIIELFKQHSLLTNPDKQANFNFGKAQQQNKPTLHHNH